MLLKTIAAAAVASCALSTAALAGQCPPEHVLEEPRELRRAPDIGVTRPVLGVVDLTGWRDMGNFRLRLRRLTVAPGGVVPTHNHADRPSIVHIVSGEIIEHNAFCAVPILHVAGDTAVEAGEGHLHWWENQGDEEVVIFSTDVVPFRARENTDM